MSKYTSIEEMIAAGETPTIKDIRHFAELEGFPKDKPKKKRSKEGKDNAATQGGDPMAGIDLDPMIYSAIHVYQRPEETLQQTMLNANRERKMHGPGTLVFRHLHSFGGTCDSGCKVKMAEEE